MIQPILHWSKPDITRCVISNRLNFHGSDTDDLLDALLQLKFINERSSEDPIRQNEIEITTLGREYLNHKKDLVKSKIFWSILIPIFVSAITSYLVTK